MDTFRSRLITKFNNTPYWNIVKDENQEIINSENIADIVLEELIEYFHNQRESVENNNTIKESYEL